MAALVAQQRTSLEQSASGTGAAESISEQSDFSPNFSPNFSLASSGSDLRSLGALQDSGPSAAEHADQATALLLGEESSLTTDALQSDPFGTAPEDSGLYNSDDIGGDLGADAGDLLSDPEFDDLSDLDYGFDDDFYGYDPYDLDGWDDLFDDWDLSEDEDADDGFFDSDPEYAGVFDYDQDDDLIDDLLEQETEASNLFENIGEFEKKHGEELDRVQALAEVLVPSQEEIAAIREADEQHSIETESAQKVDADGAVIEQMERASPEADTTFQRNDRNYYEARYEAAKDRADRAAAKAADATAVRIGRAARLFR